MTDRKTILVTGATGAQGGSVVKFLLESGKWNVRCLTRNPDSEKAQALKSAGAEIVQGDQDDVASLQAAMAGCWGLFAVTNFWEHFDKEFQQGKNTVDAAKSAGIEYTVLSSLPSTKKESSGEFTVPHFEGKAAFEDYAREVGLNMTVVHVAFYYENFLSFFPPQKQEDGTFAFGFPQGDTPLAGVAVEDIGGVLAPIFERHAEFAGKLIGIVGDDITGAEYADTMTDVLGAKVVYNHVPRDVFAAYGFPGADDLADMFAFNAKYIPNRKADWEESRQLYPKIRTFKQWVNDNKATLLAKLGIGEEETSRS